LVRLQNPLVLGIIRAVEDKTLEEREAELTEQVKKESNIKSFDDLLK
jgi:2-oxoglutarate ferredoxin oxidoreductase subunit beta